MAAFALSRLPERQGGTLLFALTLPMMLPPLLLAVALVVTQPFVVLVVAARLRSFDWAIVDAARDLRRHAARGLPARGAPARRLGHRGRRAGRRGDLA
jgi:ABC-type spermidine/putrescine transport system permease subunit II